MATGGKLQGLLSAAGRALGRLDGAAHRATITTQLGRAAGNGLKVLESPFNEAGPSGEAKEVPE